MKFTEQELKTIKQIKSTFLDSTMVVWYATPQQIKQLKDNGLSGISRRQRKNELPKMRRTDDN